MELDTSGKKLNTPTEIAGHKNNAPWSVLGKRFEENSLSGSRRIPVKAPLEGRALYGLMKDVFGRAHEIYPGLIIDKRHMLPALRYVREAPGISICWHEIRERAVDILIGGPF